MKMAMGIIYESQREIVPSVTKVSGLTAEEKFAIGKL
jgi:hypothetical protein